MSNSITIQAKHQLRNYQICKQKPPKLFGMVSTDSILIIDIMISHVFH